VSPAAGRDDVPPVVGLIDAVAAADVEVVGIHHALAADRRAVHLVVSLALLGLFGPGDADDIPDRPLVVRTL
jgi:hypothetical protein